jgi:hypothetical protein
MRTGLSYDGQAAGGSDCRDIVRAFDSQARGARGFGGTRETDDGRDRVERSAIDRLARNDQPTRKALKQRRQHDQSSTSILQRRRGCRRSSACH